MASNLSAYTVSTSHGSIAIWDSQGKGKPVVFLHGNSASKEFFAHQFESRLAKQYRLIALDLPGHGNSSKAKDPQATYNFSGYADVAIEVIKQLELDKPVVVGWSLGGHIGLSMIQKAQKLAGLLITGTPPIQISMEGFQAGFLPLPILQTLFNKVEFTREEASEFMAGAGFDVVKHPFITEAALKTDGYARAYLAESFGKGIGGDQKALVEVNETPLCVVQGLNDAGINNQYIVEAVNYKNLFNKKVYLIENSAHAVFWQQPQEFNAILSLFLAHVAE